MAELKDKLVTLECLREAYDNCVHVDDSHVTGIRGNAETDYRSGDVVLTPANIGAKALQTAVNDPAATGYATQFIATITQDAQGKITATKRTVGSASTSAAGLMTAADKTKLNGIVVSSVKGSAESTPQTGAVVLTAANVGAHPANTTLRVTNNSSYSGSTSSNMSVAQILDTSGEIRHQVYGTYNGSNTITWLDARLPNGTSNSISVRVDANGNRSYSVSDPASFRSAIEITPNNIGAPSSIYVTETTQSTILAKLRTIPTNGMATFGSNTNSLRVLTGKSSTTFGVCIGVCRRFTDSNGNDTFDFMISNAGSANMYTFRIQASSTTATSFTPGDTYLFTGTKIS